MVSTLNGSTPPSPRLSANPEVSSTTLVALGLPSAASWNPATSPSTPNSGRLAVTLATEKITSSVGVILTSVAVRLTVSANAKTTSSAVRANVSGSVRKS